LTGKLAELHHFEAKILPDRNFIQDMIGMNNGFWMESDAQEFEERLASIK